MVALDSRHNVYRSYYTVLMVNVLLLYGLTLWHSDLLVSSELYKTKSIPYNALSDCVPHSTNPGCF